MDITSLDRFFSGIHVVRPSSSELVGFLSCVWAGVMWTRTMYCHPDSDSSSMCEKRTVI